MILNAPSSLAAALLDDLAALGIEVRVLDGSIRYRPQSAMAPALLAQLQACKGEMLALLDGDLALAELRLYVADLKRNPDWRLAWERRFASARFANFASLQRVLDDAIGLAMQHHRQRDWSAFTSAVRYLHRLASGDIWDEAGPAPPPGAFDLADSLAVDSDA
ncbi:MAG TPA: hypothetical protein VFE62_08060 [Gemmataceae bacterium]|nr:hypothetical protein [Gemmataceae bacterium]